MGDAELTGDEITAWFEARGVKYRLSRRHDDRRARQMYFEEGKAEHVRGELAFAQSIIETGSFGHALDNNYAGIGACDSCHGEIRVPHTARRRARPDPAAAELRRSRRRARPTSPTRRRRRSTAATRSRAAQSYDTFFAKGRVPTWNLMGNGNWATDPGYAPKVLGIYFEMVASPPQAPTSLTSSSAHGLRPIALARRVRRAA